MHLWNDYEGTEVAGRWRLGSLLRTEGRSALFATTDTDGSPAVLRLTEALNDQAVLTERYRLIQSAGDANIVAIRSFGDAVMDGSPVSYALLEPTQESLADIVATRRLGPDETYEVATSVAAALTALHARGLVHGHVETENVVAAGDRIKLRSDGARLAPALEDRELEGVVTERTDALGLAAVVYRSLTQNRLQDAADALALPEPFASIVRNTMRGTWGVPEIQAELTRPLRSAAATPAAVPAPAATPGVAAGTATTGTVAGTAAAITPGTAHGSAAANATLPPAVAAAPTPRPEYTPRTTASASAWEQPERVSDSRRRVYLVAGAAIAVLILLFALMHHPSKHATPAASTAATAPAPSTPEAAAPAPAAAMAAKTPTASHATGSHTVATTAPPAAATAMAAGPRSGTANWRVIAYDYNREAEAQARATLINQKYPGFHAEAWSRTGHRPFLVTLGGLMTEQQAFALRYRARKAGIARDVYAQNYRR